MIRRFVLASSFVLSCIAGAKDIPVADATALKAALKAVQPGDVLVLRAGEWPDARLKIKAEGTDERPVIVRAEIPGGTIFTGDSRLSVSGHHVIVEGLWFRDPVMKEGDVMELRTTTRDLAYDCTIRDCAVTSGATKVEKGTSTRFCSLYGTGNTVEKCHFEGKVTGGTTLVMWLTPGGEGGHKIRGNYFGPRPRLGENGGETIRLGDSRTAHLNGRCEVSGNLFDRCNGEVEIISVKSNENRITGNTFLECEGAVTLRHSHRSLVDGNLFAGNHRKFTGGVRIIGEDHKVTNNWMENCEGDGSRSAISFMNAIPDSPAEGYYQVKRVLVEGNTVLDCKASFSIGLQNNKTCTLPPIDCVIRNNIVRSPERPLIELVTEAPGWKWENNVMLGKTLGIDGLPSVISAMPNPLPKRPTEIKRDSVGVRWLK